MGELQHNDAGFNELQLLSRVSGMLSNRECWRSESYEPVSACAMGRLHRCCLHWFPYARCAEMDCPRQAQAAKDAIEEPSHRLPQLSFHRLQIHALVGNQGLYPD